MTADPLTPTEAGTLDLDGFVARFGSVYEHSPWVAEGAWERRPFDGLDDFAGAFEAAVLDAPAERQLALVRAHPELAGSEAAAGALTSESENEQASAGLDRLTSAELSALRTLNEAYKEKFGFPMVFAVREHTKESILAQGEARLENAPDEEMRRALEEVFKIARLRLAELVTVQTT